MRLFFKWENVNFFFIYERKIVDMVYYINVFVKYNNNVKYINNGLKKSINSLFFKNIFYLCIIFLKNNIFFKN